MDTIAALSTPFGVSGIAVVRFSGSNCVAIIRSALNKDHFEPRRVYHGFYRLLSDDVLDEVVWTFFEKNASYTGEEMLEISCHGNPLIVRQLLRDAVARGCRAAEPGEFTRRAFLNHRIDLCRAEAVSDVIHAQSLQALTLARKQLCGSLSRKIEDFIQQLTDQIAVVEAYLDFPEEDLPEEDRSRFLKQQRQLMQAIEHLLHAHEAYAPLQNGIRTVIVGLPNAGKSTLFNRLLGQDRAIISSIPGTTRDFISETLPLEPYALRLTDTAGLRETDNAIERLGIQHTNEQLEKADLILWVVDGSQPYSADLGALKVRLPSEKTVILLNKSDCGLHPSLSETFLETSVAIETIHQQSTVKDKSALEAVEKNTDGSYGKYVRGTMSDDRNISDETTGAPMNEVRNEMFLSDVDETGVDGRKTRTSFEDGRAHISESDASDTNLSDKNDLINDRKSLFSSSVWTVSLKDEGCVTMLQQRLKRFLDERYEDVSNIGFLIHERHAEALKRVHASLQHAAMLLQQRTADDCLAADLKEALRALETIVGRVDYERVLDKIFSKFCIGK